MAGLRHAWGVEPAPGAAGGVVVFASDAPLLPVAKVVWDSKSGWIAAGRPRGMTVGNIFRCALCRRIRAVEEFFAKVAAPAAGARRDTEFAFPGSIAEVCVHEPFLSGCFGWVELPMLPEWSGSPQSVGGLR